MYLGQCSIFLKFTASEAYTPEIDKEEFPPMLQMKVYTIRQSKGCGIGSSRRLAITSRTPFVAVLKRAYTIPTILFIHMSYLPMLFWNSFINLLGNCSTGYGQRSSKSNLTNLLNIGITTNPLTAGETEHVRLDTKTRIHGSSTSRSTVWNHCRPGSNLGKAPYPDSHLTQGIDVLGWRWIWGGSKGGVSHCRRTISWWHPIWLGNFCIYGWHN
jgi:hypothetical protein